MAVVGGVALVRPREVLAQEATNEHEAVLSLRLQVAIQRLRVRYTLPICAIARHRLDHVPVWPWIAHSVPNRSARAVHPLLDK